MADKDTKIRRIVELIGVPERERMASAAGLADLPEAELDVRLERLHARAARLAEWRRTRATAPAEASS